MDRDHAQRRADQVRAFQAEVQALDAAGVVSLTAEQRAAIGTYHDGLLTRLAREFDVDRSESARQLSRGMRIASFLGAVALTAAIYSLVSRFWPRLDLPVQATLLTLFPLASLAGVELAARREPTSYVSALCAIVAFATFGLAADALGAALNVPLSPPVLWTAALFGLALALSYGFRLILAASLFIATVALPASVFHAGGVPWTAVVRYPELQTLTAFALSALALPLAQLHRPFGPAVRLVCLGVGLLGLLVLSLSGSFSLLPLSNRAAHVLYLVLMPLVAFVLLLVAMRNRWQETVNLTAVLLTVFLVLRYLDWFWDALPRFAFFLVLAALAFVWLLAMRRIRARMARVRI